MHGPGSILETYHWLAVAGSPVVAATFAQRYMPNPDEFKRIFVVADCPIWYMRLFNIVRYVANLSSKAGWKEQQVLETKTSTLTESTVVGDRTPKEGS